MKTVEELNAIKEEVEAMKKKLAVLTEEELAQVSGGGCDPGKCPRGLSTCDCACDAFCSNCRHLYRDIGFDYYKAYYLCRLYKIEWITGRDPWEVCDNRDGSD